MNVTAGRVSADSTKVRRLPGQAPIKSCARPARSDPGVDGQIHKKTAANGVRVISGHAGAGAESIISVKSASAGAGSAVPVPADRGASNTQASIRSVVKQVAPSSRVENGLWPVRPS